MRILSFVLLIVIAFGCSNSEAKRSQLIHYIPKNASVIIKTENFESFTSSIINNDFISKFKLTKDYQLLSDKLKFTYLIQPSKTALISLHKNNEDSLHVTFVTRQNKDLFVRDSLADYVEETLKYDGKTIIKSVLKSKTFYSAVVDSVFIASTQLKFVEEAYSKSIIDDDLEKIYASLNTDKSASIIVKDDNPFVKSFFVEDSLNLENFSDYLALDIDINQNSITCNGITKAKDSLNNLIDVFKNTIPQENLIPTIVPGNSDGFISLSFHDFQIFNDNLKAFRKNDSLAIQTELFKNIIEIGLIYEGDSQALILSSIDVIETNDALLAEQNLIDTYRQIEIFSFSQNNLFSEILYPFVNSKDFQMYCLLDNFYVFGTNMDILQNIIANYQNKTTISERSYFQSVKEQLSDASSILHVVNEDALSIIANKNLDEDITFKFGDYTASAIQFIYDKDFAHVHSVIQKEKAKAYDNSVVEEFSIKLDSDLLNDPQFVTNHITNQKEIVVQDISNNLYLISNTGKVLWKKQLHGPVLGQIEQIDIYKNGRLQLVFATPHRVYVIDRNGRDVAPFPGKFNDEITQPLSVFDYDKRKNYRLLVTQGQYLLMYNTKANIISGFTFKKAQGKVIHQPQHFRIGSKDYLTIKTADKLYILDRTGKNRVTPKTDHTYSDEAIYYHENKFATTTADGKLISIDTKGNTNLKNLNLSSNHHIDASTKTLVTFSENKLSIRNSTLELDYGNYTPPKFYYIYDKIYVTTTDLQTQKIYLFDSQAKLIPNFPVYGNSPIILDNIDKDKNLEFVTKGDTDTILLYQIN